MEKEIESSLVEMPPQLPLVSVIIPCRESEETISKCLDSVRSQDYGNIEIIVVDNSSKDATRRIAEEFGARVYEFGPERCAQVNFGAKNALGQYIYRVDSDFVLSGGVIRKAVEACESGGYDSVIIHNTSDPSVSFWSRIRKLERDTYIGDELVPVARFFRRRAFMTLGGYDESLIAGEDYDITNRLREAGFKLGRIDAEDMHIGEPKSMREIIQKHYVYGKSIGRFIEKDRYMAVKQLNPLRASYLKVLPSLLPSPRVFFGFVAYETVRYMAAGLGMLSRRLGIV